MGFVRPPVPMRTGAIRPLNRLEISMGVIHVVDHAGERHTFEALEGWRVMEIIRDWKLPMEWICGGACECATCHVFVHEGWLARLPPASEEEEGQLDSVPLTRRNSRLACQLLWTPELDGLEVTLAPVSA